MRVNSGKGSGRSHGLIRTNWKRQLARYGEKTGVVGQHYGSMRDSLNISAGAVNVKKMADWIGLNCSARFIHLNMHANGITSAPTGAIVWHITYYNSTDIYAGFHPGGMSDGSIMTQNIAWANFVFDWEMVIVSV